jgi:hypothetical protein
MKFFVLIMIAWGLSATADGQTAVGQWRDHLSFKHCLHIDLDASSVFAVGNNGFIKLIPQSNSFEKFSKVNGLSGTEISAIKSLDNEQIAIGYYDGAIDIIKNQSTWKIQDLKEKVMSGSKKINSFYFRNNMLYCCTDFGIMVIDVDKEEIVSTYYLGENGANLIVNQLIEFEGFYYAATDDGIIKAPVSSDRLWYYDTWKVDTYGSYTGIATIGNRLISIKKESDNLYHLLSLKDDGWEKLSEMTQFRNLSSSNNYLIVTGATAILSIDKELNVRTIKTGYSFNATSQSTPSFTDAKYSLDEKTLWITDNNYGIVKSVEGLSDESFIPNGPGSNNNQDLKFSGNSLVVAPGKRTFYWDNVFFDAQLYFFDEKWINLDAKTDALFVNQWDIIGVLPDTSNPNRVWLNSWGNGIFLVENQSVILHYNQYNSLLETIPKAGERYVRVGGTAMDKNGNLYATNSERLNGVVVRSAENNWYQYSYTSLQNHHTMSQMVIDNANNIWFIILRSNDVNGRGLFVFNTNGTIDNQWDDTYKSPFAPNENKSDDTRYAGQIRIWDKNLNEVTSNVFCLKIDLNGYLWLGTDKGVLVNYSPENVFQETYPVFRHVEVPREDNRLYVDYLLETEKITCIAVDGANRKWIGTETSGAYLVSEDGTRTITHFNTNNSPLFSNEILSIAVHPQTGEVFFGTANGIVSYRGTATEGQSTIETIRVFPNPVVPTYKGVITISQLVRDSNVKIADVSGNIVYETTSLGGQAVWDGNNMAGQRVKSGVYVVLVTSKDGALKGTAKILIVN